MDRYLVEGCGDGFAVRDATTKQEVFSGTKQEVEDWLDHRENQDRINARRLETEKPNKRRAWWKIFAV